MCFRHPGRFGRTVHRPRRLHRTEPADDHQQSGKLLPGGGLHHGRSGEKTIEIAASDVTVDCQGHRLTSNANSNSGTSVAIFANNRHDITVHDCRIMGAYSIGIDILQNNSGPNANYYVTLADNYIGGPYL